MGNEEQRTLARQIERWLNEGGRDVDDAAIAHSANRVDGQTTRRERPPGKRRD